MFGFLKNKIKGFVDNFKKEEELSATKDDNVTEKGKKQDDIKKIESLEEDITLNKVIEDSPTVSEGLTEEYKEESLVIDPEDISQERMKEQEYESEKMARKKEIGIKPEKEPVTEEYDDIKENIIMQDTSIKEKRGFFTKLADSITKKNISEKEFDRMFEELEIALLENNTALDVVEKIKESLKKEIMSEKIQRSKPHEIIREALSNAIIELFVPHEDFYSLIRKKKPYIIMFLGVNGSGKTTTIAKIAYKIKNNGLIPVLAAGDTFRAAAIQQLEEHAKKIDVRIIKQDYGSDAAAVAYDAIRHAESGKADIVLIDTGGRLHSNDNLLKELEKIKRVAKPDLTLFVGESIAGNDVIEQATVFNQKIGIDGIILTKADVDDKGGAALSVSYVTRAPIYFIGLGQEYDDIKEFTPELIMKALGLE